MQHNKENNQQRSNLGGISANRTENKSTKPNDLPDSKEDNERLQPEETFIDLPDVEDIPGQEFVHAPPLGELADTTISSADEEGTSVFGEEDTDELFLGNESDVSSVEKQTLENAAFRRSVEEDNLRRASIDQLDFQGDQLNEAGFGNNRSGRDLDIPGSELDDRNEDTGDEDEENNGFSIDKNDREN